MVLKNNVSVGNLSELPHYSNYEGFRAFGESGPVVEKCFAGVCQSITPNNVVWWEYIVYGVPWGLVTALLFIVLLFDITVERVYEPGMTFREFWEAYKDYYGIRAK
jgi:hypothetical protein